MKEQMMRKFQRFTCILLLLSANSYCQSKRNKELTVGDTIPAFSLTDQDGKVFNSADHIGKSSLVIFFYPKDESPVCTKEACSFRDRYADITNTGAIIVGINGGSVDSHKKFQVNDKLPYPLLSDSANKVLNAFGIPGKFFMTGRKTFVVDRTGRIVFVYNSSLKGSKHAEEVLSFLNKK